MKPILKLTTLIFLAGALINTSCEKENKSTYIIPPPPPSPPLICGEARPLIYANLVSAGTLSQARDFTAVAAAGNKILFAGGYLQNNIATSRVDIYDISSNSWSTAALSQSRGLIATAVVGNKIFFAGGGDNYGVYDNVDIYDVTNNTWTVLHLSQPRSGLAAASIGNKIFFAGGYTYYNNNSSNIVDIYDLSANTWSVATLSQARINLTGISAGNKIYFAGGDDKSQNYYHDIDIYDNTTNSWSTSALQVVNVVTSGITVGDNIYWAGRLDDINQHSVTGKLEIKNLTSGETSQNCLAFNYPTSVGIINNKLAIFSGYKFNINDKNKFEIYDISTKTLSIGVLPQNVEGASVISANNTLYVSGGILNGVLNNRVWKLEF